MIAPARRILVVEDDALVRSALVVNLQDLGFVVAEAASVAEALAIAGDGGDGLEAAIVDIGLPDGSGDRLVSELRRRLPAMPVIIASGTEPEDMAASHRDDMLVALIAKFYQIERVVHVVERLRQLGD